MGIDSRKFRYLLGKSCSTAPLIMAAMYLLEGWKKSCDLSVMGIYTQTSLQSFFEVTTVKRLRQYLNG